MLPSRFSELSYKMLLEAGWFPGRQVLPFIDLPTGFEIFPSAQQVLDEFGGLWVGRNELGITAPKLVIAFEPDYAESENDEFRRYEKIIGHRLYPLGNIHNDLYYLVIDDIGRVFLLMHNLLFVDSEFDKALEKLLVGTRLPEVDENGQWGKI